MERVRVIVLALFACLYEKNNFEWFLSFALKLLVPSQVWIDSFFVALEMVQRYNENDKLLLCMRVLSKGENNVFIS